MPNFYFKINHTGAGYDFFIIFQGEEKSYPLSNSIFLMLTSRNKIKPGTR